MSHPSPVRSRRLRTAAAPLAWVAVVVLLAIGGAPAAPRVALESASTASVRVTDPTPAPGAVLPPGPTVVAARVDGDGSSRVLVDGRPAVGTRVDPDGQLSERRGIEVDLAPGPHTLAIEVDGVVAREWTVHTVGLTVDHAGADPVQLGVRMAGGGPTDRPVVLVNPLAGAEAMRAIPFAVALDAVLLPVDRLEVPTDTWASLAAHREHEDAPVFLIGGTGAIGDVVGTTLGNAGFRPVRLVDADAMAAYVPAPEALVIAPDGPFDVAWRAAVTAAALNGALLLTGPDGPAPADTEPFRGAPAALLASALTEPQRASAIAALGEATAVSDDALAPRRAAEAVVVVDPDRHDLAVMAARGADPNRAVITGLDAAVEWVAAHRPDRITLVSDDAAPDRLAQAESRLRTAWLNGAAAARVEVLVDATDGLVITLTSDVPVDGAAVHVDLLGFEWPGEVEVDGRTITWRGQPRPRLPEALEPAAPDSRARIDLTATVVSDGVTQHLHAVSDAPLSPLTSVSRDGFLVAGGAGPVVGTGPLRTFSVEVEREAGLDLAAVTSEIEAILLDPRGWTADGSISLQRVGNARAADIRVVVARPVTVDLYCGRVGLRTGGSVSCWDGFRAMLNLDRWNTGVVPFHADLTIYRQYLVNHEVGHGLGHGHVFCPRPGALAPVMMQQTGGIGACVANGWPYPDFGTRPAIG